MTIPGSFAFERLSARYTFPLLRILSLYSCPFEVVVLMILGNFLPLLLDVGGVLTLCPFGRGGPGARR